jgi:hypothetical protein
VTKSTRNQQYYTETILQAAGQDTAVYLQYIKVWWWNHTDPTMLRLSQSGLKFINKFTQIPTYAVDLPNPLLNRTLLQMSRLLTCPYYINKHTKITLLGEEEYVMLKLHADNLQQYLDNLQL